VVPDVIVHGPEEDNHVLQVHQARLPPSAGQDDVERPLEGRWHVHQPKRKPEKPEQARVRREHRLVSVLCRHRDLPVLGVTVQDREHRGVAEGVQAAVYPLDQVNILDRALVQPAVVHEKPELATWLGHDYHREGPLDVRGLYDTQVEHFLELLLHLPATVLSSLVRSRVNGLGVWLELNVVCGGLELSQLPRPHALELIQESVHLSMKFRGHTRPAHLCRLRIRGGRNNRWRRRVTTCPANPTQ